MFFYLKWDSFFKHDVYGKNLDITKEKWLWWYSYVYNKWGRSHYHRLYVLIAIKLLHFFMLQLGSFNGFDAWNPSNLMIIELILKYGGLPYYWVKMVNRDEVDSSIIKNMKSTILITI